MSVGWNLIFSVNFYGRIVRWSPFEYESEYDSKWSEQYGIYSRNVYYKNCTKSDKQTKEKKKAISLHCIAVYDRITPQFSCDFSNTLSKD